MSRFVAVTSLLGVLMLGACEPGSGLPPLPVMAEAPYQLGVNEQIRLITIGEDRLTGQFSVNDGGNIAVPLLGTIHADGLTTVELEQTIKQELQDRKILLNPSVSVEVLGYRPIFIVGEVVKPGQYPYQPNMTVLRAVAIAGGYTYRAQKDYASISRDLNGHDLDGRVTRGTSVRPGDVINIFERFF
ncbi:MAG: polysaccharide biosynthesis/export family protein [Janthinobacterium lividum]